MASLPVYVKKLLCASCQMGITQVLACARAILKDNPTGMELATKAIKPIHDPGERIVVRALIKCCVCDCLARHKRLKDDCLKPPKNLTCSQWGEPGLLQNCSGKGQGRVYSASFILLISALSPIQMYVCRMRGVVQMDSGCSRTIAYRNMCQTWKKKDVEMMTLSASEMLGRSIFEWTK